MHTKEKEWEHLPRAPQRFGVEIGDAVIKAKVTAEAESMTDAEVKAAPEAGARVEAEKETELRSAAVAEDEDDSVWEQLLQLAKSGDIRAIKLYYEMQEKRQRASEGDAATMTQMAQIRRAVFGEVEDD